MLKPPISCLSPKGHLDSAVDFLANGEVNVEADGKLLGKVRAKWDTMQVAKALDERLDGKVGASEAGIAK
jgi:hypothetical protein